MATLQPLISHFIKKAQSLSDQQAEQILSDHMKISSWLKAHPNEEVDSDKVNEILSTKVDIPSPQILAHLGSAAEKKQAEPEPKPAIHEPAPTPKEMPKEVPAAKTELKTDTAIAMPTMPTPEKIEPAPLVVPDTEIAVHVDEAFKREIDDFYGKKGLFTHTNGIDTAEWKFMAGLPAAKVVEYYNSDSSNSTLDPSVVKELTESTKHQGFLKQMNDLVGQAKGKLTPYPTETMEQFFKRLGHFVMREHLETQKSNLKT
jgi:hypothetical protein